MEGYVQGVKEGDKGAPMVQVEVRDEHQVYFLDLDGQNVEEGQRIVSIPMREREGGLACGSNHACMVHRPRQATAMACIPSCPRYLPGCTPQSSSTFLPRNCSKIQLLPTSCPPPRGITTAPLTAAELELLDMMTKVSGFWKGLRSVK
jgi:hypothetical protein